jgi:hypothetical protein
VADTPLQVAGREAKPEITLSITDVLTDAAKRWVASVQDYSGVAYHSLANLATSPRYFQDMLDQMDDIGVGSLPIVLMAGFFIGAVLVLQTGAQFVRFGQTALTGDAVAVALVRELGPTLTGILVAGRCASGMASELGSMLVTEQVDAMRAMGTDPGRKLVTPRVLATILVLPLLTALPAGRMCGIHIFLAFGRRGVLDARHERAGFRGLDARHGQAAGLRFYPRHRGLLQGTHRAWRNARSGPRHDTSRRCVFRAHYRRRRISYQAGSLPGQQTILVCRTRPPRRVLRNPSAAGNELPL